MKSPLSSPGKTSHTPTSRWAHSISQTVRGALMGIGLLSVNRAAAADQSPDIAERLERSKEFLQSSMSENQELKNMIEQLWSKLKGMPGVPDVLYDDSYNITPEAQKWIRENLPKQYIDLSDKLSGAIGQQNQLPINSIGRKEQAFIVGNVLLFSILVILSLKKKKKNWKDFKMVYEKIMDSSGKTDHAEILAFLKRLLLQNEKEMAMNAEIRQAIASAPRDPETSTIDTPLSPSEALRSQLKNLQKDSLCILTHLNGDCWHILVKERVTAVDDRVSWKVLIDNLEYTMRISQKAEIILEYSENNEQKNYEDPLDDFTKIEIIDTAGAPIIPRYPNNQIGTTDMEPNEWYMTHSGVSEHITPGKRVMMITGSGGVYILKVLPDNGGFEVLPESPKSSYPAGTTLSHINAHGGLVLRDDNYTTRVEQIIPLDTQSGSISATENSPTEGDTPLNLDGLSHANLVILRDEIIDDLSLAQTADEYNHSSVVKIAAKLERINAKIRTLPPT